MKGLVHEWVLKRGRYDNGLSKVGRESEFD